MTYGVKGKLKIVDYIFLQGNGMEQLEASLLVRCREKNITLSRKKFQIIESVKFAAYIVSSDGIKAEPQKVLLTNFPSPKDRNELKSFLGLANQLGKFLPDMAHLSGELKKLNSTKNAYFWTEIHEAEFKKLKGAGSDRNSRLLRPE